MDWMVYMVGVFFALIGAGCVALVVFNLPGAWIMLAVAVIIEFLIDPLYLSPEHQPTFAIWLLLTCLALAGVGELFEWLAGAAGGKLGGGSTRGMWGAIIGGIMGAIGFTPVFGFLPVVGTLVGALVGTFVGAMVGEMTGPQPRPWHATVRPAVGATIGRVFGTAGKLAVAIAIWLALSVSALWL